MRALVLQGLYYGVVTILGTMIVLAIVNLGGCAPARDRTDWGALAHGVGQVEGTR